MIRAVVTALVLAAVGCQTANKGDSDEIAGARTQVQTLFDAVAKGDCPTLGALVPATAAPAACDKFLHEWREDLHIKLVDITDARRDGRDRTAIIVRTKVMRHEQEKEMLLRVTHVNGSWQIVP